VAQKFITPITIKQLASAGSDALTVFLDGEVYGRVKLEAGGRISWSDGTGTYDTNLYRDGANTLATDDVLKAVAGIVTLAVNGTPTASLPNGALAVDTTNNIFYFRSNNAWNQVSGGAGGASVTVSDSAPASPSSGDLWFDSTLGVMFIYYDSVWVDVGGGGVVNFVLDTVTAKGDLIVGTADGAADNLAAGANGTYLKANSSTATGLEWASIPAINAAAIISAAGGDGTNGQALTTNGAGTLDFTTIVGTTEASIISAVGADGVAGSVLKTNGSGDLSFGDVALGTNTTGNYVSDLTGGTGVTITHTPGEGSSPTVAIGQSVATSATPTFAGLTLNGNITFEGATADDYETIIAITDPTSDRVIVFPDLTGTVVTTGDTGSITSLMIADGTIVNADINASAAIAHSKLANATAGQVLLGTTTTGVVTATTISGDITIDGAGVASIAANSVALGTDTTGNYVASLVAGTGVTLTNGTASEGGTPTVAIGQAVGTTSNVQFNDVTVDGNLTVNGTTTTLNTETLAIEDNIVVLNSNVTASPTTNAGIEVERGTSANVLVRWNETTDKWEATNDGTTYGNIVTTSDSGTITSDMIVDGTIVNADINASAAIALSKLASGTSAQVVIANSSGVPTYTTLSGDITISDTGVASIASNSVALGTDTTGNYVSDVTASTGITVTHTPGEGSSATVALNATLDDLSNVSVATPSSGQFLKWNGTAWVADTIVGGASISDTAPASPTAGQIWFQSTNGKTFVYYDSQWIEVGGVGTGARMVSSSSAPASPLEGSMWFDTDTAQTFVYYDSQWIEIGASGVTASVQDSAPADPVSGQIWFNSLTGGTYVYYGTNWIEVGASPFSALVNTINAKGDLLVGTADNTLGGLTAGSANQVLTVDSSTATGLKWSTPTVYQAVVANVSDTEIGYLDGVTSAIQTQLNTKASTGKAIAMSLIFGGG
jgi:hypothetical protein